MIKESKYCSKVIKNVLTKNLCSLKKLMKIFRTLVNVASVIIIMLMMMLKYEIIVILLENIEALHIEILISMLDEIIKFLLIMQELGKFNLKINVIPNGLESYMSFNINE